MKKSSLNPDWCLIVLSMSGPYSVIFTWTFFPSKEWYCKLLYTLTCDVWNAKLFVGFVEVSNVYYVIDVIVFQLVSEHFGKSHQVRDHTCDVGLILRLLLGDHTVTDTHQDWVDDLKKRLGMWMMMPYEVVSFLLQSHIIPSLHPQCRIHLSS